MNSIGNIQYVQVTDDVTSTRNRLSMPVNLRTEISDREKKIMGCLIEDPTRPLGLLLDSLAIKCFFLGVGCDGGAVGHQNQTNWFLCDVSL
jgi:hypothetical protein